MVFWDVFLFVMAVGFATLLFSAVASVVVYAFIAGMAAFYRARERFSKV